jgi:hypothetical protein
MSAIKYVVPNKTVQPYFGLYINVGINSIDEGDMPGVILNKSTAASYGIGLLLGTTAKVNENILLYFEGRYGGDWMETELQGFSRETMNYGGFTLMSGLMFLF